MLAANGVTASGIWLTDDDGALRLAIREGDVISGEHGGRIRGLKFLEHIADSPTADPHYNEHGDLIYRR